MAPHPPQTGMRKIMRIPRPTERKMHTQPGNLPVKAQICTNSIILSANQSHLALCSVGAPQSSALNRNECRLAPWQEKKKPDDMDVVAPIHSANPNDAGAAHPQIKTHRAHHALAERGQTGAVLPRRCVTLCYISVQQLTRHQF